MRSRKWLYVPAWLLMLAIFAIDNRQILPASAAHLLYVGVVLLGLWAPGTWLGLQAAVVSTVLMTIGQLLAPQEGEPLSGHLTFVISLVVLWITAFGVNLFGRSIAAQHRAEEALGESAKDLEDLKYALDQSAIVARTNVRGDITYINEKFCQISKYSRHELLGQNHRILNSGLHPPEFFRDMYATIGRGRVWRGEIRNRAKDGTEYWVDTTIVPLLDARGHPHQYIAIRYDITERKASEAALREQEALAQLGKMAAVVAHEVRNPLAGMRGALQIMDRRLAPDSRERDVIKEIIARIDMLTVIVQDLLVFAKPRQPSKTTFPLTPFMRDVCGLVSADPQFSGIELAYDVDDAQITADHAQLKSILHNLLLNAAQAMQGKGKVHVTSDTREPWHELRVIDAGPGMPPEVQARLFEPFFTTKHRGTGLGLATARRMVQAHGGSMTFEFPDAGGTTVVIRFPTRLATNATISPSDREVFR